MRLLWTPTRPGKSLLGLIFSLICLGPVAPTAPALAAPGRTIVPIHHNKRSFRIPFNTDPSVRSRLKEVRLFVSEDFGVTWKAAGKALPDDLSVSFTAPRDGEFWFAAISVDKKGRMTPSSDAEVEPNIKVIVDTTAPSVVLEPLPRRGSTASVRWEVRDEHLDLASLILEYQPLGSRDWRQVPVRKPALIGMESWNAGTAEPVKVRLTVTDKASNSKEGVITLGDGTPRNPALSRPADDPASAAPPPLGSFASDGSERIPSGNDSGPPSMPNLADEAPTFEPPPRSSAPAAAPPTMPSPNDIGLAGGSRAAAEPLPPPSQALAPAPAPMPVPSNNLTAPPPAAGMSAAPPTPPASGKPELVSSPRFALKYAVDDAGPSGPASVELWVTQDGGRVWSRKSDDPDKQSPFPVDLGGEGTFGLRLVARSSSGQGDAPPAPGEPPHLLIEVDSTPPVVKLDPVKIENAPEGVRLTITWHASDVHLGPRCVMLSWRPDQPGARWETIAAQLDNTGQYIWNVPSNVPTRFHVRVDVMDTLGHRGWAESTENGPINIDRTRPKSRIIGLEPINGRGPSARPIR